MIYGRSFAQQRGADSRVEGVRLRYLAENCELVVLCICIVRAIFLGSPVPLESTNRMETGEYCSIGLEIKFSTEEAVFM